MLKGCSVSEFLHICVLKWSDVFIGRVFAFVFC